MDAQSFIPRSHYYVGNGLGLKEVDATVQISPKGEFSRFRRSRAQRQRSPENGIGRGPTAVGLNFQDVFGGIGGGGGHPNQERLIKHGTVGG